MNIVSLEFDILRYTKMYPHSTVIIQIMTHECNILTAVLAEVYRESHEHMCIYQGMYNTSAAWIATSAAQYIISVL